jgi:hypothetical protein
VANRAELPALSGSGSGRRECGLVFEYSFRVEFSSRVFPKRQKLGSSTAALPKVH